MSFLKYRNPDFIDGSVQTIADPDELNENLEDVARVVNGNLGGENLTPGVKLANAKFECQRSNVALHFNFGSAYTAATRPMFKTSKQMYLVGVAIIAANTTNATEWYVKNGSTVMADVLTGHSGNTISYFVNDISSASLAVNETISLVFTGTGTIQGVTFFFTVDHQT